MKDILSTQEIIQRASLEIPNGTKKVISIAIAFNVDILISIENIISKKNRIKNRSR